MEETNSYEVRFSFNGEIYKIHIIVEDFVKQKGEWIEVWTYRSTITCNGDVYDVEIVIEIGRMMKPTCNDFSVHLYKKEEDIEENEDTNKDFCAEVKILDIRDFFS